MLSRAKKRQLHAPLLLTDVLIAIEGYECTCVCLTSEKVWEHKVMHRCRSQLADESDGTKIAPSVTSKLKPVRSPWSKVTAILAVAILAPVD